ncbi:MAG: DUF1697 domain-containing protein [Spirochaetes bacterium]|nr:DUF1697 domain-containing protein [Spirochaetota bacterium]
MKYIALLRGINVSGQKRVPMVELAALFKALKFNDVATYIQSGNVVFSAPTTSEAKLVTTIEAALAKKFGFTVDVVLRTEKEWANISKSHRYLDKNNSNDAKIYITFLRAAVEKNLATELEKYCTKGEQYALDGREVYLCYPESYGTTKLSNQIIEKKFGTVATTRNWRTTLALRDMLR